MWSDVDKGDFADSAGAGAAIVCAAPGCFSALGNLVNWGMAGLRVGVGIDLGFAVTIPELIVLLALGVCKLVSPLGKATSELGEALGVAVVLRRGVRIVGRCRVGDGDVDTPTLILVVGGECWLDNSTVLPLSSLAELSRLVLMDEGLELAALRRLDVRCCPVCLLTLRWSL